MLLQVGQGSSNGDATSVVLSIDPDGKWYGVELIVLCCVREGEDGWIGRGGNGDWRGVIDVGETEVVAKEGVRL